MNNTHPVRGPASRATLFALSFAVAMAAGVVHAQPEYPPRNDKEYYAPNLVGQGFGFLAPQQDRIWSAEYVARALMVTYGEARVNRRFFADFLLEGVYPSGMPSEPIPLGMLQENLVEQPDAAFRLEAYYWQRPSEDWEISVDMATRLHLVKNDIPAEFHGRLTATHQGFAGVTPVFAGLFAGPEIRPVDDPVGGMTLGTFVMLSPSRQSLTTASLAITWWGQADPFQNLARLRIGQTVTPLKRKLVVRVDMGVDLRQVRVERYEAAFLATPEQTRYLDLVLEGTLLARLPGNVRLGISGRFLPVHAPDRYIVRWYRPVYPEAGVSLERKFAVVDFEAGYTFAWVPPYPNLEGDYDDSGTGIIPGSSPGHLLYLTLGLKI